MLEIKNLHANINDKEILKGLNLTIKAGETHAIMGPNGSGKSTLSKIIIGHPDYEVTSGSIHFNGIDILEMDIDERSILGLFLGFQYPVEIPGVKNIEFLRLAYNARQKANNEPEMDKESFAKLITETMEFLDLHNDIYTERFVNSGFSGGEKKRNEILQMAILKPKMTILDEIDSGLDIDALRMVANGVNKLMNKDSSVLLITHYQRLLDYIKPDYVHIMANGRILKSGGSELALELEENGYEQYLLEV